MLEDLYKGNIDKFQYKFKELYFSAVSYHDAGDSEKYYHHFMFGLLLTLGDKYVITSNRESGYGRYDIAVKNNGVSKVIKIGMAFSGKE